VLDRFLRRAGILAELLGFLRRERLWWLVPVVLSLALLLWVAAATAPGSPLTPFLYAVF
jgi:hypothetical protein